MKKDELFDAMREIDDKYISDAAPRRAGAFGKSRIGAALIAASLAVIMLAAAIALPFSFRGDPPPGTQPHGATVAGSDTDTSPETSEYEDTWEHISVSGPNGDGREEDRVPGVTYLTSPSFRSSRENGRISREFRDAAAEFAFELMKQSRDAYIGGGLLVSPLSAMLALSMAANGAEGETLAQMERVIAGGMPIERLNQELYDYAMSLACTEDSKTNIANSIWVSSAPAFRVNDKFIKTVENTFDADIIAVDFADRDIYKSINKWVEYETFGMIDSLYDEPLDPRMATVLINALAFDAIWEEQENDLFQKEGLFNGKDTVKYMNTECDAYIEGNNEVGIVKNYKGGHYAFVALLPKEGADIGDYAASLDGKTFLSLFDKRDKVSSGKVEVSGKIPHFSFDCEIELNDVLINMGMPRAFDPASAEFGGLGESDLGNISIQNVLQKTYIRLDNSGTRAAAVTAMEAPGAGEPTTEPKKYRVELDRPFVYAIVDTATGLPIFLGVCETIK